MAAATRMHLAEKGRDPRSYALVAFGGAGPVHAYALARLLKLQRIIVPLGAGVISALGFLVAAPATDAVRSHVARLENLDFAAVNALYEEMEFDARALLLAAGVVGETIRFEWSTDMRHVGQGFEIAVPLRRHVLSRTDLPEIRRAFFGAYAARFDRVVEDVPIEAMNWRLHAEGPGSSISLARTGSAPGSARRGIRDVVFDGFGALPCPVYDRYALAAGTAFAGPAVIEERECTCVVGPDASISVDWFMNLIIDLSPTQGASA
jgi:N-methylhydantoinase A